MNNEQKLAMINMCAAAVLEDKQLQYLNGDSWTDSISDISGAVRNIIDFNMEYRVKPEPEPKKSVPFKGQIGYVYDAYRERRRLYRFLKMDGDRYMCTQMDDLNTSGVAWDHFEPIPGVVQFRPMSELDPAYDGKLNVLYANGKTCSFMYAGNRYIGADWVPVGFQLLKE